LFSNFPVDVLQLHGEEQPERVSIIRTKFKVPVIKSVSLRTKQDLIKIRDFSLVADQLLIDAEKPDKLSPPGGNGVTFDWKLISGFDWKVPWMLAGGLDCSNVQEAIATSGATQVDVSSGVESRPGIKDTKLIYDFVSTVRGKNYDG
jgi:phosphoribosylanthranilate isomerase